MVAKKGKNYHRISSAAAKQCASSLRRIVRKLFSTAAETLDSNVVSVVHITHFMAVVKQKQQRLYMECELL